MGTQGSNMPQKERQADEVEVEDRGKNGYCFIEVLAHKNKT